MNGRRPKGQLRVRLLCVLSVYLHRVGIGFHLGGIKYASGRHHRTTTLVVNYYCCALAHVHLCLPPACGQDCNEPGLVFRATRKATLVSRDKGRAILARIGTRPTIRGGEATAIQGKDK